MLIPLLGNLRSPVFLQLVYMLIEDEQIADNMCMMGLFPLLANLVDIENMREQVCNIIVRICTRSSNSGLLCLKMFIGN